MRQTPSGQAVAPIETWTVTNPALLRILQGLSASGGVIAARAMIRDAHSPEAARRAMAQAMRAACQAGRLAYLSGRISNRLDLKGANYILDAACSSSLIAIPRAGSSSKERLIASIIFCATWTVPIE